MFTFIGYLILVWLLFTCGTAICVVAIYWYETRNAPDERIPSPRLTTASVLAVFANTLASMLLFTATRPFGTFARKVPGPAAHAPPVILIHGLFSNAAAWVCFGKALEAEGYTYSTYCYSSRKQTVDEILDGLEGHVSAVERHCPGVTPLIVCHSLGGLLARRWLALEGNATRVAGLVTIGTPHEGSKLAALGSGRLTAALRPEGALTVSLRGAPQTQIPCVSLASPTDTTVLPAASLVPPQGWRLRITPPYGHFTMIFKKPVHDMVLEELRNIRSSV